MPGVSTDPMICGLVGLLIAGYVFFLAPFYWLWKDLFATATPVEWAPILVFQVAVIIFMRWLVDVRFREPVVSTILHPVGFSFLILTSIYAGLRRTVGAGVQWKKRLYDSESSID